MVAFARDLRPAVAIALVACGLAAGAAHGQQGAAPAMTASAIMAGTGSDSWRSQGGVAGPWWSGGANLAGGPAADGGFWFGLPGLGFGGVQGSQRGVGTTAPGVTTMSGAPGMFSASQFVPFVTGVVPVVGEGFPAAQPPVTMPAPSLVLNRPLVTMPVPAARPAAGIRVRSSAPASRKRSRESVERGDLRLLDEPAGRHAARGALAHYQEAARLADDDADVHVRLAIVHEGLGRRDLADRAVRRALVIDGRLAVESRPAPGVADELADTSRPIAAVGPHGLLILEEIAARGDEHVATEAARRLEWLRAAWAARWAEDGGGRAAP